MDKRLDRMMEVAVMVMESFADFSNKYSYSMVIKKNVITCFLCVCNIWQKKKKKQRLDTAVTVRRYHWCLGVKCQLHVKNGWK